MDNFCPATIVCVTSKAVASITMSPPPRLDTFRMTFAGQTIGSPPDPVTLALTERGPVEAVTATRVIGGRDSPSPTVTLTVSVVAGPPLWHATPIAASRAGRMTAETVADAARPRLGIGIGMTTEKPVSSLTIPVSNHGTRRPRGTDSGLGALKHLSHGLVKRLRRDWFF